jgi:subtilisin
MLRRKEHWCLFLSFVLIISSFSFPLFTLSSVIGGNNSASGNDNGDSGGFATFLKAYAQTTITGFAPQSNTFNVLQSESRQRQQIQLPPLSYPYSNNNDIRGTPGLSSSSTNNKIVTTAAATARGIPNQFIVMLKDSLDSTITDSSHSNSNALSSTLSNPSALSPSNTGSSVDISSRLAAVNNVLRDISQRAISMGAQVPYTFNSVIHGFTARIPNRQVIDALAKDPRVSYIEQDQQVQVFQIPSQPTGTNQALPTGINRIDADLSPIRSGDGTDNNNVDVDIAILDTGIDLSHPDLNVYVQKTFVSGTSSANDDNGHGTHVAGIAAAKDNSYGVVGVAPGARLWDIKVLDSTGSGLISDIIAGIDYIASFANQVDVANLSFGCQCKSAALDSAINNAVAKGITFVVAAGNAHTDASTFSPANNPNVIAVSAIADSDGKCGGVRSSTSYGRDDSFASFSNYGSTVDMAAPGVSILSTYKGSTYAYMSGTSMAAPHAAGAAALYKGTVNLSASSSSVKNALQSQGSKMSTVCDGNGHGYFTGDPDSYHEPLLYVGTQLPTPTPTPTPVDTTPPETTITSAIDGNGNGLPLSSGSTAAVTSSNSITISFNGIDNIDISGFQCSLDGQPGAACGSTAGSSNSRSVSFSNLAAGTHTFMVRAIDTSANPDPTPATFTWTITQTTPTPTPLPSPTPTLCPIKQLQLVMELLGDIQGLNPQIAFAIAPALNTLQKVLSSSCGLGTTTPTFMNPIPTPFGIFANSNQNNNNNNNVKAAACNLLNEFTNQVNIRTQYREITPTQAAYLIGQSFSPHSAKQIAKQLGCLLAGSNGINNNNNGIDNNNNDQTGRLMLFNKGTPSITSDPNANSPSFMNSWQRQQQQFFQLPSKQQLLQLPQEQMPQIPSQSPSRSAAAVIPSPQQQQLQPWQQLVQQQLQQRQAQLPFYPYIYGYYP